MVWKKVRLGKRVRKNGCLCLEMRPGSMTCLGKRNVANGRNIFGLFRRSRGENEARGLELFRSGKRNVAYGHFEAPEVFNM